ncbi:MAG TPA: integrase core domain-containing protein [Bryobacteraceae bacterium]|nr:integrase core domain-containing protein [Bryobacteraceae bacterium]
MRAILWAAVQLFSFRLRSRASLELELIALRNQLSVLERRYPKRIHFPKADRHLWILLYRLWPKAYRWMSVMHPSTVIVWHRQGFRFFWRWRYGDHRGGSNKFPLEIRDLARRLRDENPTWGGPRIRAELLKLGIEISHSSVARFIRGLGFHGPYDPPRRILPAWKTFFRNHLRETAAADLFVVVTATYRLLYGFVVLGLARRKILHLEVTDHPTQDWLADQIAAALGEKNRVKFLLRDRDSCYGSVFRKRVKALGVVDRPVDRQSPWQNCYVERVISTLRRECLNHIVPINERHLRSLLKEYVAYYNESRPHWGLDYDAPEHRPVDRRYHGKKIIGRPILGGLHHRYERRAA